jgi:hypothetical protein
MPTIKEDTTEQGSLAPNYRATILCAEDCLATPLTFWFLHTFGREAFDEEGNIWHPRTIADECEAALGRPLPEANLDRLLAGLTIRTTDLFSHSLRRFLVIARVLSGEPFEPHISQPASVMDCAWALTEGLLLVPPDEKHPEPFCDDIRHYLREILKHEGFIRPPGPMKLAIDGDFSHQVLDLISADLSLQADIDRQQQTKMQEVDTMLTDMLQKMVRQLKSLPEVQQDPTGKDLESRLATFLSAR